MTDDRKAQLDSIGFKWAKPNGLKVWNAHFDELVAYKAEVWHYAVSFFDLKFCYKVSSSSHFHCNVITSQNGHCNYPTRSDDNSGRFILLHLFLNVQIRVLSLKCVSFTRAHALDVDSLSFLQRLGDGSQRRDQTKRLATLTNNIPENWMASDLNGVRKSIVSL